MLQRLSLIEENILLWIQEHLRNCIFTMIFKTITILGNGGFVWLAVSGLLAVAKENRRVGVMSFAALTCSVLINNILIKRLVARERPYETIPELTTLIGAQDDFSFPSGHTSSSFAVAIVLFFCLSRKCGLSALTLAALMGFSRLYLGVHYLSDVVCGALIGTGIAMLILKVARVA